MNYYQILEIRENASPEVIKAAYKVMVKKYHPDNFKGDVVTMENKIRQINLAYATLSNPDLKRKYDEEIAQSKGNNDTKQYQGNTVNTSTGNSESRYKEKDQNITKNTQNERRTRRIPGFRTNKKWKKIIASLFYFIIVFLIAIATIEGSEDCYTSRDKILLLLQNIGVMFIIIGVPYIVLTDVFRWSKKIKFFANKRILFTIVFLPTVWFLSFILVGGILFSNIDRAYSDEYKAKEAVRRAEEEKRLAAQAKAEEEKKLVAQNAEQEELTEVIVQGLEKQEPILQGQTPEKGTAEIKKEEKAINNEDRDVKLVTTVEANELVYSLDQVDKAIEQYDIYTNPYFLEGIKDYVNELNVMMSEFGEQEQKVIRLEELLKQHKIGSDKWRKEILELNGKSVIEVDKVKRLEAKVDTSILNVLKDDSRKIYFEISTLPKTIGGSIFDIDYYFYYGDLKNNRPNGKGALFTLVDSSLKLNYIGEFKEGQMSGKGILFGEEIMLPTIKYIGKFRENQFSGEGTIYDNTWYKETIAIGIAEIEDGIEQGKEQKTPKELINEKNSFGIMQYILENENMPSIEQMYTDVSVLLPIAIYQGKIDKNEYNGKGTQYNLAGGIQYKGEFKQGEYEGKGISYYVESQKQYEGEFRQGTYHGKGTLYNSDGSIRLKGEFQKEPIEWAVILAHTVTPMDIYRQSKGDVE